MDPRKGQFFSLDALLALVLVLFGLLAAGAVSSSLDAQAVNLEANARLTEHSTDALNQLLRTPGRPSDWFLLGTVDNTTLPSAGLAYEPSVLDAAKTARFFNLTSTPQGLEEARALLALRESGYNFSFSLLLANGTPVYATLYSTPIQLRVTATSESVAVLNGTPLRARLTVWLEPTP